MVDGLEEVKLGQSLKKIIEKPKQAQESCM